MCKDEFLTWGEKGGVFKHLNSICLHFFSLMFMVLSMVHFLGDLGIQNWAITLLRKGFNC